MYCMLIPPDCVLKLPSDLHMLQSVDLISPPVACLWLDVHTDHTSWRKDSNQWKIISYVSQ